MVYGLRKLPNKDLYRVFNKETGEVHSKATTKGNALKQIRLLYMLDRKKGGEISYPKLEQSLEQNTSIIGEGCCAKCNATNLEIDGGTINKSGFPIVDYRQQRKLLQARKDNLQEDIKMKNIRIGRLHNADINRLTQQQVNQLERERIATEISVDNSEREINSINTRIDRIDRMYGKTEESMDRNDGYDVGGVGLTKPLASKTFTSPYQPTGKYMTPWRWVLYKERELQNSTYSNMMKDPSVNSLYYKLKEKAGNNFNVDWLEANYMKNRKGIKSEPKPKETKQDKLEKSLKGTKKITEFF